MYSSTLSGRLVNFTCHVTSGIYIGRLPIYTTLQGYIALPWMIDKVFERRSAALVRVLMYGAYLGFFYFQMHFAWGTL